MTAKEKADELIDKFGNALYSDTEEQDSAKKCALICVEQCYTEAYKQGNEIALLRQDFWNEVKKEIENC